MASLYFSTAAWSTFENGYVYTAAVVKATWQYTLPTDLHIKVAIYTAVIFKAKMVMYSAVRPGYENGYINGSHFQSITVCSAAVFHTKMAMHTTAGPSYKNGYIHGSRFQCENSYIPCCRAYL